MKIIKSKNRIPVKICPIDPLYIPMYNGLNTGADLIANLPDNGNGKRQISLPPNHLYTIDCGFTMEIEKDWMAEIKPHRFLLTRGVNAVNLTFDSTYKEPVRIIVHNIGKEIVIIKNGDRVAQMFLKPVYYFTWDVK